jgi:hypothetical protein
MVISSLKFFRCFIIAPIASHAEIPGRPISLHIAFEYKYNKHLGFSSLMVYNLIDHKGYFIEYAREWNPVFVDIPEVLENNLLLLHANI